jgi:hypothetical protein|tara:strand:- start:250 stop:2091 length:1842 start_codon:yes stop_codon:yes gene_type:complete
VARNIKKEISTQKDVSYTNKDFESLRTDLKRFATTHFGDLVKDTSDASLAGLLIDLAAYVGDVNSYYIDHQFNESSLETAVEQKNLERKIREAGVEISGKSPAIGFVDITVTIPALLSGGEYSPNKDYLPKIKKETIFGSSSGVDFYLLEDVDFAEEDSAGNLIASFEIGRVSNGIPLEFLLKKQGVVTSSKLSQETFNISSTFQPFRLITVKQNNVNEIVRVVDSDGDDYYEVQSLTQSTVFKRSVNSRKDKEYAPERIQLIHAPKRFIKIRNGSGNVSLQFGSGNELNFDEDIIPDPSDHAIKLFGDRKTLNKITIDPNSFLGTQTLGISPRDTTLTVTVRSGGGLNHNVSARQITSVKTLITDFGVNTPTSIASKIRASTVVINPSPCLGGEDEPSLESLRQIALLNRNSQNRIVTREDLIARVYSMPAKFGRVFRASVRDNPNNPQAAQLYIMSRDRNSKLIISPDTLKESLSSYLSQFRLVSDAIDILDASIVNIGLNFTVTIDPEAIASVVIAAINSKISSYLSIGNYQIDQPIKIGEIENLIMNTPDVDAIMSLSFTNKTGTEGGRIYSNYFYDPQRHIDRGYLFPPRGGIFEMKYPNFDIIGRIS